MLNTSRLLLRPAVIEDAAYLMELNSDPLVVQYTGDVGFQNIVEAQSLVKERLITQFEKYRMGRFQVFLQDGTYIGWCGLRFFPETKEVDLGYRFIRKHWGMGYATEASQECLKYGFNSLGLKRIVAKAMPQNTSSIKVLQKLGMTFRGMTFDNSDPCPFVLFDITCEEFKR